MCTLCASRRPFDPLATNDQHLTPAERAWLLESGAGGIGSGTGSGLQLNAPFSMTQIAAQLTDGFWDFNGEQRRAFDLGPDRTLTYDISALDDPAVRRLVEQSFEAWTDVTGIRFVEVAGPTIRTESGDAAASSSTSAVMNVGQVFDGTLTSTSDSDWVRVSLTAGQTYTFTMDARGGGGLDSFLTLRNASGNLLASNDDRGFGDRNSTISFTAAYSGTYYLQAASFASDSLGSYRLGVAREGTNTGADITFDDSDEGAYSTSELEGNTILSSFINLQPDWDLDAISMNSYWFQTMVHEIGHALGLGHAGNYNGTATWGVNNGYDNDSWQASIMSYFAQGDGANVGQGGFTGDSVNPNIGASYAYLATLMPADILAIQSLYGSDFETRSGTTIYGANSNVRGYFGQLMDQAFGGAAATTSIFINNPVALTIFDTGGRDTLDFSPFSAAQRINLNAGTFSNVAGLRENLQIAVGVVIEDAIGGRGRDVLVGNASGNMLNGNAGNDTLQGSDGNDTLIGGAGADRLDGGAGSNFASYVTATASVTIDLENRSANRGDAAGDVLISIANLRGSDYGDRLFGDDLGNRINGLGGNDRLSGRAGNDALDGDAGNDVIAGGTGNDTIWGDSGVDQIIFNSGLDVIRDFANDVDTLVLDRNLWGGGNRSVASILSTYAVDLGSSVELLFSTTNVIRVEGIASISLLSNDISFI